MENSLRAAAEQYEPSKVGNIADLSRIGIDEVGLERKTYGEGDNAFTIDVITVDGEDYRVPISVVAQIQSLIKNKDIPDFTHFNVMKAGTTMKDTKYTVIPLAD